MSCRSEIPALRILSRVLAHACLSLAGAATLAAQPAPETPVATQSRTFTLVEGDDIAFRRAENTEAFSQSRVSQIAQDDQGFMWFGTQYGLHRFDGYGDTVFAADSRLRNQISGVFVYAIHKDRAGRLWVASDQGLDLFDPARGFFSHIDYGGATRESATIQSIYEDRSGGIWLATTAGLYGLDPDGRTRVRYRHDDDPGSLGSSDVKFAREDRAGTFWVTTTAGLEALDRAKGRVLVRVPLREPRELNFIEDRAGKLWIYQAGGAGLASYDRTTRTLTTYQFVDTAGRAMPRFGIYAALEDGDGGLWFGTGGQGLLRFDTAHQRFIRYRNNSGDPLSLGGDDIVALFQDSQGSIWVALHGMPLNLFSPAQPSFRKLPARPAATNERAEKMVNTLLEVDGRSLWISFVGILLSVDSTTGARENLRERLGLQADVISMAQDARGRVWLGTVGAGVVAVDPSGRVTHYLHDPRDPASLADDVVNDILVDHAQNLWFATWGGLSRLDEPRGVFENYKAPGMEPKYLALAEDGSHRLWLASHLYGLQRFDPLTREFVTYPPTGAPDGVSNGRVNAVHVDRRGIVWAGTQNGLDALDPATRRIRAYRTDDGLPGNAVSCLLEDAQGGIWSGTNNGIARLDPRTGEFQSFSGADGLPGTDFTGWGACYQSASHEMYFAGFAGATAFDPDRVRSSSHVPPVAFTDLLIAGRRYPDGPPETRPLVLPALGALTLPYSRNTFTAGFAALSYTNPSATRYRFRLAGLAEEWQVVGSDRRVASYNSLPPGDYRLEVQAAAAGGPWSEPRQLAITILEPWWQTAWFRVLVGLLVLGSAWAIYRARVRQIRHQFEIRLDERVAERTRIARELHDSLLQGFHGLMFRLQAVRNLLPVRAQEAATALDEALSRGDETVEEARVAVADLRTFGAGEPSLETALRALAQDMPLLHRPGAPECRFIVEGEPRALIPLVRDDVLQVGREAFRNAVLHAKARVVQVEVQWGAERFSLRVRDDGVGLDPQMIAQGRDGHWGLQGMRERTRQVGGSLEIRSDSAVGTLVELGIPARRAYASAA